MRLRLIFVFCVFTIAVHTSAFAEVNDQVAISQGDLTVIKKYVAEINEQIAGIQAVQSKLEQEAESVRVRIHKAGKGT